MIQERGEHPGADAQSCALKDMGFLPVALDPAPYVI